MTINSVSGTAHTPRIRALISVPVVATQPTSRKPIIVSIGSRVSVRLSDGHGGTIGYYPVESYMRLVKELSGSTLDAWA